MRSQGRSALKPGRLILANTTRLDAAIKDVSVVLCAAGPFSATSRPMVDACLRKHVHYLDITGEIDVFEALAARDAEAGARGVMLPSGVGFDVVPSDCLAAHLKRRLPDANDLKLYLSLGVDMSRGTAKTMIEAIAAGTRLRRNRRIVTPRLGGGGVMRFREGGEANENSGQLGRRRHCVPFDRHSQHRGPFRGVSGDQGVRSNALVRQVVPWADLHANPP